MADQRIAFRALAAGVLVLGALAGPADAVANPSLHSPSNRIYCQYMPSLKLLRCDVSYKTGFTHRPSWCHADWGQGFGVQPTGGARVLCISDSMYSPDAKVIPYGQTRHYGPFTCTSKRTGLRCRNPRGHGFQLSHSRQTMF